MALGSIQFGGLASGLPPDMVDQLMKAQEYRLKSLNRDKDFFTNQKSTFSELESLLSSLSSTATTLQEDSTFAPHTASSSDEDVLEVTADSSAVAGTHTVAVSRLASSHTVMTGAGVTSETDTLASVATFSFDYNGQSYDNTDFLIAADDDLATIASRIGSFEFTDGSGDTEDGISASVLYDGSNYRLVLAAKDQGAQTRNSDGTTATSRIENLTIDMTFNGGAVFDTTTATTGTSTSFTLGAGVTNSADTLSAVGGTPFTFTYGGTTYESGSSYTNGVLDGGGTLFEVAVGDTLADIASSINGIGATNLQAQVINDGTNNRLVMEGSSSISAFDTDFTFTSAGNFTDANFVGGYFTTAERQL